MSYGGDERGLEPGSDEAKEAAHAYTTSIGGWGDGGDGERVRGRKRRRNKKK